MTEEFARRRGGMHSAGAHRGRSRTGVDRGPNPYMVFRSAPAPPRRGRARAKRRGLVAGVTAIVVAIGTGTALWALSPGGGGKHRPLGNASATTAPPGILHAALAGWSLAAPVSREMVLSAPGGSLVVAGGLTANDRSADGVFRITPAGGDASEIGVLVEGVHDAAGAIVSGRLYVLGGGTPATTADVEALDLGAAETAGSGSGSVGVPAQAHIVGRLPQPRSDCGGATLGGTVYVTGGYDGSAPDATVLGTTDGVHFRAVAELPVPVRYGAVAAVGSDLYVVGGEMAGGPNAGRLTGAVQVVDLVHGTARVVAHLATPLAGTVAAVLGGWLYVAGGTTSTSPSGGATGAVAAVERIDPATFAVTSVAPLPRPVAFAGAAVAGRSAYILGGEAGGTTLASVEELSLERA